MTNSGDTHNSITGGVGGSTMQAGTINNYFGPAPEPVAHAVDEWVRLVEESRVWTRVVPTHPHDRLRASAAAAARRLALLRDEALTDDDPWQDPDLVRRFGERVDWLVSRKITTDVTPAEAVLLALVPLLHQCLWLRAVARYRVVDPTGFTPALAPDDLRESYEGHLRDHDKLVGRATLPELPGRTSARHEIGWWLFHRWLRQRAELLQPAEVDDLLAEVSTPLLRQVLTTRVVRDLLHGLRVDSRWLTDERRVSAPDAVETAFGGTSDDQPLRKHLVALLLGAAHTSAIEVTDLSDVLVWHLGIPNPVEVDALFATVRDASWQHREDGPVLKASCDHEAVVEALRTHASRLSDLLRDVRLVTKFHGLEALGALPSRATGDLVKPAEDDEGNPRFSGWSKFHIDEDRVRDLLMGEQLYQDRRVAVRELYQNALDACRYRQARETYGERLGRPSHWVGEIRFFQGVDEHGRHHLDCVDNGIGMDIPELTGVFARAGVRFAQLPEFREEQLEWRTVDPPVELHPNSRFGIGVLSYFMLADEIEVTTCRTGRDGGPTGPTLRVTISGPGQLFQIRKLADHGLPGTRVRLYFREPDPEGKVIRWLDEVLAVADFSTTAEHGGRTSRWEPGVLANRPRSGEPRYGELLPSGTGSVVWCGESGALLVDGLLVASSTRRAATGDQPGGRGAARGFVVNLTGSTAPRLSVDRTRLVDDVADQVERLLVAALPRLASHGKSLVTTTWLAEVATGSFRLADLVTRGLIENGFRLTSFDHEVDMAVSGWMSLDPLLVRGRDDIDSRRSDRTMFGSPADHVLLWRLLAHAPNARLAMLGEAAPDLVLPDVDVPALPSDVHLLTLKRRWRATDQDLTARTIVRIAVKTGADPRAVAERARLLGFTVRPDPVPAGRGGKAQPEAWRTAVTEPDPIDPSDDDRTLLRSSTPTDDGPMVPIGHLLKTSRSLGISLEQAIDRIAAHGARTTTTSPPPADAADVLLLSRTLSGDHPWLPPHLPVPASRLADALVALGIPISRGIERLTAYGYRVQGDFRMDTLDQADHRMLRSGGFGSNSSSHGGPITLDRLLRMGEASGRTLHEVADHLRGIGLPVPDVAETVRAAVARLPKRSQPLP